MNQPIQFLIFENLLGLGHWLRFLGYSVTIAVNPANAAASVQENADVIVLITGKNQLEGLPEIKSHQLLSHDIAEQIQELDALFSIIGHCSPLTRCSRCNSPVSAAAKSSIRDKVPARVFTKFEKFWECETCLQIY